MTEPKPNYKIGRPASMKKPLDMLDFIIEYKRNHDGNSPALRDIMDGTGISSTSVVTYYLSQLQYAGLIYVDPRVSRSIEVVGGSWTHTN